MGDTSLARRISAMLAKTALAAAAAFIAALWMSAPPAHACSCRFPHDWGFIGAESGRLHANAAGVAWYAQKIRANENLAARFTVEIQDQGEFRPLPAKVSPVEDFSGIHVIAPEGELPRSRVLLDTRLIHDSWRKGCRDERTKARGGFGGGRP